MVADPAVRGIIVNSRDVTGRKKTESALRESEARKSGIMESALDCVLIMDHRGHVVEFNPAAEKTFRVARSEVLGRQMSDLIVLPEAHPAQCEGLPAYLISDGPLLGKRLELTAVRPDGSEFPIEMAITRIPLEGMPLFAGHIRDITERKAAERALRLAEERYALAARGANDGLWDWDMERNQIYLSLRWKEMLGYADEEITADPDDWLALIHPDDESRVRSELARHQRGILPAYESEHRIRPRMAAIVGY